MKKLVSCEFNMDTACVELKYEDGAQISIDCIAVENEVAQNMYERSELDYLIYNDPVGYANLVLNGDVEGYLRSDTDYRLLDERENKRNGRDVVQMNSFPFLKIIDRTLLRIDLSPKR